jgi:hypothetical protein
VPPIERRERIGITAGGRSQKSLILHLQTHMRPAANL